MLFGVVCGAHVVTASAASAQTLSSGVVDRCVRGSVKLFVQKSKDEGYSGSGTLIDPRGYILTNLHVVGYTKPAGRPPGALIDRRNVVAVGMTNSSRKAATYQYIAKVVRADVRLDLALLRIVADIKGRPIRNARFAAVPLGDSRSLRPGSPVYALGYPLGANSVNLSGGHVTGFELSFDDGIAWIRTDAEFHPGSSGGMLVDRQGRLVGVPTLMYRHRGISEVIELARPTDRIPRLWLSELRAGSISEAKMEGVARLEPNVPWRDRFTGEGHLMAAEERHHYVLPRNRPGAVRVSNGLHIDVWRRDGKLLRHGNGRLEVLSSDPAGTVASISAPTSAAKPVDYFVKFEGANRGAAPLLGAETVNELLRLARRESAHAKPRVARVRSRSVPLYEKGLGTKSVVGSLVDRSTGARTQGAVLVARTGTDLAEALDRFESAEIDGSQLTDALQAYASTDVQGQFRIDSLSTGVRLHCVAVARGFQPATFTIAARSSDPPLIRLYPIHMHR